MSDTLFHYVLNEFSDLAVEMEKHSNDHIHDDDSADRLGAAVEGVCADRIKAIIAKFRRLDRVAD